MYIYIYMYIMYVKNERRKWLERVSRNSYREWSIIVAKREIFNGALRFFNRDFSRFEARFFL